MIKALLLVFDPIPTWERIIEAKRGAGFVLAGYLLPLLLLVSVGEGCGLMHWGKARGTTTIVEPFSLAETVVYEAGQLILTLVVVFVTTRLVKSVGETFHGRHSFAQTLTAVSYGLSPIFLLRLLNAFPEVSPWVGWGLGIVLSVMILYHGLPRVMEPDPTHAFGLYLTSILLITLVTGLERFVTAWYLAGRFTKLNAIISHLIGQTSH